MKLAFRKIIFDLGNVLVGVKDIFAFPGFFENFDAPPEKIRRFFSDRSRRIFLDFETGKITPLQFYEAAKAELGYRGDYAKFRKDYCAWLGMELKEDVFDIIHSIKRSRLDVDLAILSNINELHWEYIGRNWPELCANFRKLFASFRMGMAKPDPEIYQRVAREMNAAVPNECLFIDDLEKNCAGARQAGMTAYRFDGDAAKLRAYLERIFDVKLV